MRKVILVTHLFRHVIYKSLFVRLIVVTHRGQAWSQTWIRQNTLLDLVVEGL